MGIVEANNKLPRMCYGNASGYFCNYDCDHGSTCSAVTNIKWGACDCKFKRACHIGRQEIQKEIRDRKGEDNYKCPFIEHFDIEAFKEEIEVPEGIIKMSPIEDNDTKAKVLEIGDKGEPGEPGIYPFDMKILPSHREVTKNVLPRIMATEKYESKK